MPFTCTYIYALQNEKGIFFYWNKSNGDKLLFLELYAYYIPSAIPLFFDFILIFFSFIFFSSLKDVSYAVLLCTVPVPVCIYGLCTYV